MFLFGVFLWVSTSAVRKVWKNRMWNATIISWTWTTAHRYTNFDAMEQFHRFNVPEFYLQCLGNYVNPLCVPWPWWKCFRNPMQRVFLVFTSPPHRHTPIHVRRSLDFIPGCWKHVAALLDLSKWMIWSVFHEQTFGIKQSLMFRTPIELQVCIHAILESCNGWTEAQFTNCARTNMHILVFWLHLLLMRST